MNTNNDVSIEPTALYYGSKAITSAKESVNDLSASIKDTNISDDELTTLELLPKAKSTIETARNKTEQLERQIAKTIEKIKELDPQVAYLFDYLDEQDIDIDTIYESTHQTIEEIIDSQNALFEQSDYYEEYIEKNSKEMSNIHSEIYALESDLDVLKTNEAETGINWPEETRQAYNAQVEEIENKIAFLTEKYASLAQDTLLMKQLRDYAFESACNMYSLYDDFEEKSEPQMDSRQEGSNIFYGAHVNDDEWFEKEKDNFITIGYDEEKQAYIYGLASEIALYQYYGNEENFKTETIIDEKGNAVEVYNLEGYNNGEMINGLYGSLNSPVHQYEEDTLAFLTEDERRRIIYLYNIGEYDKARKYVNYLEDKAEQRHGKELSDEVTKQIDSYYRLAKSGGSYTEASAYAETIDLLIREGFIDGLKTFVAGMDNLANSDGKVSAQEYKTQYLIQYIYDRYGDSGLKSFLATGSYEVSSSIGNMIPSMIVSNLPGFQWAGLTMMGLSATGNAVEQAKQAGLDDSAAWFYGILSGLSEAGLEYALGGIPGLSDFKKFENLPGLKGFVAKMLSEGTEESLQSILDPLFLTMASGGQIPFEVDWNEVIKSGIYGMVTAGIMNGTAEGIGVVVEGIQYVIPADRATAIIEEFNGQDLTKPEVKAELIERLNGKPSASEINQKVLDALNGPRNYVTETIAELLTDSETIENCLSDEMFTDDQIEEIINRLPEDIIANYVVDMVGEGTATRAFEKLKGYKQRGVLSELCDEKYITKIREKVTDANYAKSFSEFYIEYGTGKKYADLIIIPELTQYLCHDINNFNYLVLYNEYEWVSENILSKIESDTLVECLTAETIDEMTDEKRTKFNEQYPGVIDGIMEKTTYDAKDLMDPSGSLFSKFLDYENHKYLFGNKPQSDYIDMCYDYVVSNFDPDAPYTMLPDYFMIDGLGEKLLDNSSIADYINKQDYNTYEVLFQNEKIYDKINKNSHFFGTYAIEVIKGNVDGGNANVTDIINAYRNECAILESQNSPLPATMDEVNNYINKTGILNSDIISKMYDSAHVFTVSDLEELVDYMTALDLLQITDTTLGPELTKYIYDYLNVCLLEDKKIMDISHFQSHIYNYTSYYAKSCGLDVTIDFNFDYNESNIGTWGYADWSTLSLGGKGRICVPVYKHYFNDTHSFCLTLDTIFHECQHIIQKYNMLAAQDSNDINGYALMHTIETILEQYDSNYYDNNYWNIYYEVDARYIAASTLLAYLKEISPEVYAEKETIINKRLTEAEELYSKGYDNQATYNGQLMSRDMALDKIISDNPDLLNTYPILQNIYNLDGSRKTVLELQIAYNNAVNDGNTDIEEMLGFWIAYSGYSTESIIKDLYVMTYDESTEEIANYYDGIYEDLIGYKLYDTMLVESNNFTDDTYIDKINQIIEKMKQDDPANSDKIDALGKLIIETYEELKAQYA